MRTGARRPRRGLLLVAALLVAALGAVYAVFDRIGARREAEMAAAAEAANAALTEARSADAMSWAPDELLGAEHAYRSALAAQRMEDARAWPLPDAARIVAGYAAAEQSARGALGVSRARRTTASASAASLLADAQGAVSASHTLASRIHLGAERRSLLARARAALDEGRVYEREGDFGTATVRARQAIDLATQVRDHAAAVAARYADAETLARWRKWKNDTISWSRREARPAIVVSKEAHLLTLFVRGEAVKTYRVDLGFNWIADKAVAGDGATPEGRYRVVARKANGASIYYKALLLDFPNADDRAEFSRARRTGTAPASAAIGGLIEIHGEGGRGRDWTNGCVALTNSDMDDLFARVGIGTPVTIVGSDDYGAIAELANGQRPGAAGRHP